MTIYDLGEQLLLASTDRISAFDWVLPAVMDTGNTDTGNTGMVKAAWCWRLVVVCGACRGGLLAAPHLHLLPAYGFSVDGIISQRARSVFP